MAPRARTPSRFPGVCFPKIRPSCWNCWPTWRATPASRKKKSNCASRTGRRNWRRSVPSRPSWPTKSSPKWCSDLTPIPGLRPPLRSEKEVELRKQNRAQELEAQRSEPSFLADEKFAEVVFGSHPYSRIAPTPQSIARIDRKALASFAQTYLVPNNATLILLGRLPARAEALKLVEEYLGSWQQKALPAPPKPDFPETRHAVYLVDRPGSVQADIHVGGLAVTRADPDFFPLSVGSVVLGGGGRSRMFLNIREKKGYAYDAHAILQP